MLMLQLLFSYKFLISNDANLILIGADRVNGLTDLVVSFSYKTYPLRSVWLDGMDIVQKWNGNSNGMMYERNKVGLTRLMRK